MKCGSSWEEEEVAAKATPSADGGPIARYEIEVMIDSIPTCRHHMTADKLLCNTTTY